MNKRLLIEHFRESLNNILSNKLRSVLTIVIIGIGIMALVSMLTVVDSIKNSIQDNYNKLGVNFITVKAKTDYVFNNQGEMASKSSPITYEQVQQLENNFSFPDISISYNTVVKNGLRVVYKDKKTNPNCKLQAISYNYFKIANQELAKGRTFSNYESNSSSKNVIIGDEIAKKLFPDNDIIGKIISIDMVKYQVIGVLAPSVNLYNSYDRDIYVSIGESRSTYYNPRTSYSIYCSVNDVEKMEALEQEFRGKFRAVRKLRPGKEDNFTLSRSDKSIEDQMSDLNFLNIISYIISTITLAAASIGLINIMLVAVTERTREIGIKKAIGANNKAILSLFLIESIIITELGCILGIILGLITGNIIAIFTKTGFIVPWLWILVAVILSLIIGIISGIYPAIKATKLDPIESLRYE